MPRQIALLRGINLGPARRVAMADLRELLESLGHAEVRTHLQSGNAVFTSDEPPDEVARRLEREIAKRLSVETDVVVRTRDELADVVRRDPFGELADDPKRYQVSFFARDPDPGAVRELEAADFSPERVVVSGREIYAWHPDGVQRSKLARILAGERFGSPGTARNWNTVTKLLALADE
jgi:uncharacterized protein (DUF1697 family)